MSETPRAQARASETSHQTRGQDQIATGGGARARQTQVSRESGPGSRPWTGWVALGAVLMVLVGSYQVVIGLTALLRPAYYAVVEDQLLVTLDFTVWGWIHLVLGAVAVAAGFGLMAGQSWARVVGIIMALVSSMVNLAFIAAYPAWSITVIALDVLVIYAITMQAQEDGDRVG